MNQKASRKFQILSLSGGGYRGLHIAHILEIIEQKIQGRIAHHFDLIAGTSVGGIIALGLALEIQATDIRKLLEAVGPSLFPKPPPSFQSVKELMEQKGWVNKLLFFKKHKDQLFEDFESTQSSWYDSKALADALKQEQFFGSRRIEDLSHPVIIPTVNYSNGNPKFYKTDHHSSLTFDGGLQILDVALGTSAAPIYFPVHKINDNRIVDGGLIANDPTQVAIHEAMMFFGVRPTLFGDESTGIDDLQVLSLGTLAPKHFVETTRPLNQGMLTWGAGVFDLAGSAQEAMAAFMIDRHMLPGKVIRLPSLEARPEKAPGLADTGTAATETLRSSAQNLAQAAFGNPQFNKLFEHKAQTLNDVRAKFTKGTDNA